MRIWQSSSYVTWHDQLIQQPGCIKDAMTYTTTEINHIPGCQLKKTTYTINRHMIARALLGIPVRGAK